MYTKMVQKQNQCKKLHWKN